MLTKFSKAFLPVGLVAFFATGLASSASAEPSEPSTTVPPVEIPQTTEESPTVPVPPSPQEDVPAPEPEPVKVEPTQAEIDAYLYSLAVAAQQERAFLLAIALTPPGEKPYLEFSDCRQAVDYLFDGRWDHGRALKITWRESGYRPAARNGSFWGCAQISPLIRKKFLSGSWDDPYFNVLAMRRVIDHPDWGWCHWDIKNFCAPGGEF